MKLSNKLTFAAAAVMSMTIGGTAIAQQSINDPARDDYYATMKDRKVVFVPVFMGLDLTEGWSKIMANQAEALGYHYEVRNSNFNTAAGAQTITSLISEKPDVIVVQNPDVQSYARLLKRAEDAGIHVIQLNMKTNILTTGFVGADVVAIGEAQARAAVEHCASAEKPGKVLILAGPPTSPFSAYMLRGYENILNDNASMEVVGIQSTGSYESSKAKSITQVVVQQHPDLCATLGVWDAPDIGTAAALDEAGLSDQVFVSTSGGGGELSCRGIREGMWDHYVSYDVPGQGRDLNALISSALQDTNEVGSTKTVLYTPLVEFTADNVDQQDCWTLDSLR
ncbi:sugar ABC transporter substrate-binding protein [Antarcticimicrobium sediminis]|uniref:Sugar ABC transporter substrate-binding protein n=1 Tax=Antarcticimicrobium sediminis TaxID=2546227 RepID=A0A4R5F134_9RHOB|nr:sugar ABC transporter substrate-binding protein [Antarcticimicrobium sediminis]TDE41144.1 sugar ABC transporter substrate-binding protein [Antarcticimicrobium sediminis]